MEPEYDTPEYEQSECEKKKQEQAHHEKEYRKYVERINKPHGKNRKQRF